MKRKASLFTLLAGAVLLQACLKNDEVDPGQKDRDNDAQIQQYITDKGLNARGTESGLYYSKTIERPDTARMGSTGSQVYVYYQGKRLSDDFIFDQSKMGRPLIFALHNKQLIAGFDEGIGLLREGEEAILLLPSRLAYGNAALQNIPAYSNLRFDVKLLKVRTEDEALKVFAKDSLKLDPAKLVELTAARGTYYISTQPGTGDAIENSSGKQVTVKYRGRFIDGSNFANAGSTDQFIYKSDANRIPGYLEAIKNMKLGEKGYILIPSAHAYKETGSPLDNQGRQAIPGYTPLVYDVEITAIQ